MKLDRFVIELDSKSASYQPGRVVVGAVVVSNSEVVSFKDFYVETLGHAVVSWKEGNGYNCQTFANEEVYFRHHIPLIPDSGQGVKQELPEGHHRFKFHFELPKELPSSYEGTHGCVRYLVKARITRHKFHHDFECEKLFDVRDTFDLNIVRDEAMEPRSVCKSKNHMIFRSGQILAKAWLDHGGYAPGEKIYFNAIIENHTGRSIESSTVTFVKRETCTSEGIQKIHDDVLWEEKRGKIEESKTLEWNQVPIEVPNILPSGLPHCSIIDVSYEIKLTVHSGLLTSDLVESLPIMIGTIPLRSSAVKGVNHHDIPCVCVDCLQK